jgi:murein DD-endopeptidase MepM/ murein hydrolase activator NlpD
LRTALVLAFLWPAGAWTAWAQFAAPSAVVRTSPDTPARGTLAWLHVEDDWSRNDQAPLLGVEGEAAGEPLHFAPGVERGFVALLGIPLDGGDTIPVTLRLARQERVDSATVLVAVRRRVFPSERLKVAPRMVEYDSATRARIDSEQALAREVSRRSHQTPRLWSEPIVLPRSSRITSRFGGARAFNGRVTSRHLGTDFAGAIGEPVIAAARGVPGPRRRAGDRLLPPEPGGCVGGRHRRGRPADRRGGKDGESDRTASALGDALRGHQRRPDESG